MKRLPTRPRTTTSWGGDDGDGGPPRSLEALLDDPPPPRPRRTRRPELATVLLGLLVLVVLALSTAAFVRSQAGDRTTVGSDPVGAGPRAAGTGVPTGLPAVGTYVRSSIADDGTVEVTHWIRSARPIGTVALDAPPAPPGATPVSATHVEATAPGANVTRVASAAGSQRFDFDVPVRVVRLRYRLTGVLDRSPSLRGRALARLVALDVHYAGRAGPTRVEVVGGVLAMACAPAGLDDVSARPCGGPGPGHWQVVLAGAERDDRVMTQVDLG